MTTVGYGDNMTCEWDHPKKAEFEACHKELTDEMIDKKHTYVAPCKYNQELEHLIDDNSIHSGMLKAIHSQKDNNKNTKQAQNAARSRGRDISFVMANTPNRNEFVKSYTNHTFIHTTYRQCIG